MQQGSKIRGGLVVLGGDNVSPLVEIGLTDLPKTGEAPPLATALGGKRWWYYDFFGFFSMY